MYDPMMVAPMREELTHAGVQSLGTANEVESVLNEAGKTSLVVVNSVCGCAAANARPGVRLSMQHGTQPDNVVTVFAGVDREATDCARRFFKGYMPSSPSIALLKDGEVAFILQRHDIEGRSPEDIATKISAAYDEHCG